MPGGSDLERVEGLAEEVSAPLADLPGQSPGVVLDALRLHLGRVDDCLRIPAGILAGLGGILAGRVERQVREEVGPDQALDLVADLVEPRSEVAIGPKFVDGGVEDGEFFCFGHGGQGVEG